MQRQRHDNLLRAWRNLTECAAQQDPTQVDGSLIFNDSSLMVKAAIDGAGVIYNAEEAIREELAAGRLETILKPFAATSAGYYLYYPRQSRTLPKLRAFIEHLKGRRPQRGGSER